MEFYAIIQGDKETVLAYTSRVDIIVATLAKLGERVSTGAWIYALGNGLRAEYKESKDGILYNKLGFDTVMSVKTKLLSEEAVLTSKNKKANAIVKANKEKDDEIALKLQELKSPSDKQIKEPNEPNDKALMFKGKGGKGQKGKGGAKGNNTWNESSQWPTQWSPPDATSTASYANNWTQPVKGQWRLSDVVPPVSPANHWTPPAKGKGDGKPKVDPSTLWCDRIETFACFKVPKKHFFFLYKKNHEVELVNK